MFSNVNSFVELPFYYKGLWRKYSTSYCPPDEFKLGRELQQSMSIQARPVYTSDLFSAIDLNCQCLLRFATSQKDYNPYFNITFVRQGYFTFNAFPKPIDATNTNVFVKKPHCEYSVTQMADRLFLCTIFNFSNTFFERLKEEYKPNYIRFFTNPDIFTQQLIATPELEFLHYTIWQLIQQGNVSRLLIDCLVLEVVDLIMEILTQNTSTTIGEIRQSIKKNHWETIQKAKQYMANNYYQDISLKQLSLHCSVSPFHFSRIFKKFTNYSPYSYLTDLRLKHAEFLLKTSSASTVADIGFNCGFPNPDHFSTAFSNKYKMPPTKYRTQKLSNQE